MRMKLCVRFACVHGRTPAFRHNPNHRYQYQNHPPTISYRWRRAQKLDRTPTDRTQRREGEGGKLYQHVRGWIWLRWEWNCACALHVYMGGPQLFVIIYQTTATNISIRIILMYTYLDSRFLSSSWVLASMQSLSSWCPFKSFWTSGKHASCAPAPVKAQELIFKSLMFSKDSTVRFLCVPFCRYFWWLFCRCVALPAEKTPEFWMINGHILGRHTGFSLQLHAGSVSFLKPQRADSLKSFGSLIGAELVKGKESVYMCVHVCVWV